LESGNDIYYKYLIDYLKWRVETDKGQMITVSLRKIAKFHKIPQSKFILSFLRGRSLKNVFKELGLSGYHLWRIGKKQLFCFYKEDLKRWLDEHLEGN